MADDRHGIIGWGSKKIRSHVSTSLTRSIAQQQSGKINQFKGDWSELNADLLVEALLYLPQDHLFEVMSVSRAWKKAILEGRDLWRKVIVAGADFVGIDDVESVGLKGVEETEGSLERGNGSHVLLDVLRVAEDVEFWRDCDFSENRMVSGGGVLGSNLRFVDLPGKAIFSSFFPVLFANCPNLMSPTLWDEPHDDIRSIHVCHKRLEMLKLEGMCPFSVIIDCPALLDLHLGYDVYGLYDSKSAIQAPSPNCPRLTSLHLSDLHSPRGVLESIAQHAPNIKHLKMSINKVNAFLTATQFKQSGSECAC